MTKITKRMLALFMAMLMMFSCMAVSASADGTEGTTPGAGTEGTTPGAGTENTTPGAGTEGEGTEGEGEETITYTVVSKAPECVYDEENRTITVTVPEFIEVKPSNEEKIIQYNDVKIEISPEASEMEVEGKLVFFNLEYGTTYSVTAYVKTKTSTHTTPAATFKVKQAQNAPATPVPTAVSSTSITVVADTGCQYALKDTEGEFVCEWTDSKGKDSILFTGLESETDYTVLAKRPANDEYYESGVVSITVTTKKPGVAGVPDLSVFDKTNNSITVTAVTETEEQTVEYSLDGETWQSSNVFKNLKADTQYTIYARYTFDAATQDPSAVSEGLVVKTNAKANFEADEDKLSFSFETTYANAETKITAKGDGPANMNDVIYGDTRIIPVSYEVVYGSETIKEETPWDGGKVTETGSFTAPDHAEKIVTVKVTYEKQEYKGKDANGNANWESVEYIVEENEIKMGREDSAATRVLEFFEMILNFLLNTVPQFLAGLMGSDVWGRLFDALGKLGGAMG